MPDTPPTAEQLKARFPEFAGVADERIDLVLAETASFVDHTWIDADIVPAKLYLAAHILASEGVLLPDGHGDGTKGAVQSVRVGDTSVAFGASGAGVIAAGQSLGLTNTSYGMRFLALRKRNVPAVAVAK